MTRVIALEGLPFSGKSTSIEAASNHNSSIVTVPEYHDLDHLVGGFNYNELPLSSEMQLNALSLPRDRGAQMAVRTRGPSQFTRDARQVSHFDHRLRTSDRQ